RNGCSKSSRQQQPAQASWSRAASHPASESDGVADGSQRCCADRKQKFRSRSFQPPTPTRRSQRAEPLLSTAGSCLARFRQTPESKQRVVPCEKASCFRGTAFVFSSIMFDDACHWMKSFRDIRSYGAQK